MQITCKYNADGMQLLMQMIVLSLETTAGAFTNLSVILAVNLLRA